MSEASSLTSRLKELALRFGFDPVGFTTIVSLDEGRAAIRAWVKEGRHGDMRYLENFDERWNKFFSEIPDAKSVICLGVNYYTPEPSKERPALSGRVARYAWGRDYHEVIREKHAALIEELKKDFGPGFKAKSCVDIQPIPERFAASQSGFGFLGKHTGVLSSKYGPWLFLSEIVTNLELTPSEPSIGDCGTCVHCQKVCPTGALDDDYKIDARLCIAYLTIEHKGVIPRELRPKIKDWIFGCDECLDICPFTSKTKETSWEAFKSGAGSFLDIENLFSLSSNSSYEKKFRGTPVLRAGRKQMLRNACVVLGNSGRKEAIPYLKKALREASEMVRLHAAWALGRLDLPEARETLQAHRQRETDSGVLEEIALALQ